MEHTELADSPVVSTAPPRRIFFRWLTGAASAIAGVVLGIPVVGYFVGLRKRKIAWVTLGPVDSFPASETRMVLFDTPLRQPWDGVTAHTGVYVRYEGRNDKAEEKFLVLAVNCTHLGCPVEWFPQSGLFMCPCHGGVYYEDGEHASGPPPRRLYHCVWRVQNGQLEVQAPHFPTLQDTLEDTA